MKHCCPKTLTFLKAFTILLYMVPSGDVSAPAKEGCESDKEKAEEGNLHTSSFTVVRHE